MNDAKVGDFVLTETYNFDFEIGEVLWRNNSQMLIRDCRTNFMSLTWYPSAAHGNRQQMLALHKKVKKMVIERLEKRRIYEMEAAEKCGALAQEIRRFIKNEMKRLDIDA